MNKTRSVTLAFLITYIIASILILGCKTSAQSNSHQNDLETFVSQKLQGESEIKYNATKTFALCYEKRQGDHIKRVFRYFIVKIADNRIIEEGSFSSGYVKWISNDTIEVVSGSSLSNVEEPTKKIIRLESKQQ